MHLQRHPLPQASIGTQRELLSEHFGRAGNRPKAYLQASLHADEIPGMLVAHHLRQQLAALDAAGQIVGEIILVTVANPIGLAQAMHGVIHGRFDRDSGINFNRSYFNPVPALKRTLENQLGDDPTRNVELIRREVRLAVADWQTRTETEALKKILLSLAIDADIVLDLHCDSEAVLHLYTGTPLADAVAPLSALLGARAVLLATESGEQPFDEACGRIWWELAEHFRGLPVPPACLSVTVELRGQCDVDHTFARADAAALLAYLGHAGLIDAAPVTLPAALCTPTPLAGVEPLTAPHAGIVVFAAAPGQTMRAGDLVAELIEPLTGVQTALHATVDGVLFARTLQRYVQRGGGVAKIAGSVAFRTGNLLGQ